MKELYNKIKPVGHRVIVLVDVDEKETHSFTKEDGTKGKIYMANEYSWDSRITNFTQGVLLTDYKNLKAGTHVLAHHNSMGEECELTDKRIPHGHKLFSVEDIFVYFGVIDGKLIPIDGFMLAERIYVEQSSVLEAEKVKIPNKLKILAKPDSITDFEVGDIAITYIHSDYEMTHNVNGTVETAIRLRYSDCLAKETI
jgi:uncharacterized ubiquitin-like protein YukD